MNLWDTMARTRHLLFLCGKLFFIDGIDGRMTNGNRGAFHRIIKIHAYYWSGDISTLSNFSWKSLLSHIPWPILMHSKSPYTSQIFPNSKSLHWKDIRPYASPTRLQLGINTLRPSVNLQTLLGHLSIHQELQRHPHKMSFDLIELLADLFGWDHAVEDVACFDAFRGQEGSVVVECFDWVERLVCVMGG